MLDLNTNQSNRQTDGPTEAAEQPGEAKRPRHWRQLRLFPSGHGADVRRLWAANPRAGDVYALGAGASELPAPRARFVSFTREGPPTSSTHTLPCR
jgi:hypothetical protein